MARRKKKSWFSGGAGLGAAIATESGPDLGGAEAVRARGYWELVWRRLRRDKVAIASGIFIILLIPSPSSARRSPSTSSATARTTSSPAPRRSTASACCPANPWTHIESTTDTRTRPRRPRPRRGQPARPGRVPAPALRRAGLARGRAALDLRGDGDRGDPRLDRRLLPRLARHDHLAHHRDHDGLPAAALHRRAGGDGRPAARRDHASEASSRTG